MASAAAAATSSINILSGGVDMLDLLGMSAECNSFSSAGVNESNRGEEGRCRKKDGAARTDAAFDVLEVGAPPRQSTPPVVLPAPAPAMPVTNIGCSPGMASKTVFVMADFQGDGARMELSLRQSQVLAEKAVGHNNTVSYAILGNVAPNSCSASPRDSLLVALDLTGGGGSKPSETLKIEARNVMLFSGQGELGWIRLLASGDLREVATPSDVDAVEVLRRKTPFAGANKQLRNRPDIQAHDASLASIPTKLSKAQLEVAMFLKLVSVASLTMNAPELVLSFAKKLGRQGIGDDVALSSLVGFLSTFGGSIEEGVSRLMHGNELTPEGLGMLPVARAVVESVLDYARGPIMQYLKRSLLVHAVEKGPSTNSFVWLAPRGIDFQSAVGKLPIDMNSATLQPEWEQGPSDHHEWAILFNRRFKSFVDALDAGQAHPSQFRAYVSMSLGAKQEDLPLRAFAMSPMKTCYGFAGNKASPFATVHTQSGGPNPTTA